LTTLHVLIGVPGSGKSTLASKLAAEGAVIVSSDELRTVLTGDASAPLHMDGEVWAMFHQSVRSFLAEGKDVVADATNLTTFSRIQYASAGADRVVAHVMCTPYPACEVRNQIRDRVVPDYVMARMEEQMDEINIALLNQEFDGVVLHGVFGEEEL
jgi:predicted kinase